MTATLEDRIRDNLGRVHDRIAEAAVAGGRDPREVELVVVTKGHPVEVAQAAIAAGARHLGENYPEAGLTKIEALASYSEVKWHMVGHVQSRKARLTSQHYDFLHSLDRSKLANRLNRFAEEYERVLPVLLEFNVSGEASKYGWPASQEHDWPQLLEELGAIVDLPNLAVRGLMTMAPFFSDQQAARPYFARLRRLRDYLAAQFPQASWNELSMGMSGDFEAAIQEGATLVRIGTAILGPRS